MKSRAIAGSIAVLALAVGIAACGDDDDDDTNDTTTTVAAGGVATDAAAPVTVSSGS
jgi:hypothetical protein